MTRVLTVLPLLFTLACNQEDYYEKEFLENPFKTETPGGDQGGSTTGGGDTGGSSGGTGGEVTDPGSTGGSDGGGTSGGDEVVGTAYTETFTQKEINTKAVDILWVIDDSGSMADEQTALGTNFTAFINDFIDSGVDFKMAITTTDVSSVEKRGAMVQAPYGSLTSAFAQQNERDFLQLFQDMVKVGTRGSGYEKGIAASKFFMEKHPNFLRANAYLAVVYMSDEEDQSEGTVKDYMDHLKGLKSDAGLVKAYSIVDTHAVSSQSSYGMTLGFERYKQASNLTAGQLADIKGNFHTTLAEIGGDLRSLLDSFALAHTPLDGTLKVFINNLQVNNYSFDLASRAIKFDENDLPEVGATIRVEYKY